MKLTRELEVLPGSPNTLIYQGRIVIDLGGKNAEAEVDGEWYLCTHGHADHIAGLRRKGLKYIPKKDMWALSAAGRRSMVYGFSSKESPLFSYDLMKGDVEVEISDTDVEKIELPGHTPGHTAYLLGGFVFLGDAVFGQRILEGFVFPFHEDFWLALSSLDRAEELVRGSDGAIVAHGPIYTNVAKILDLIRINRDYMIKLAEKVKEALKLEPQSAEGLVIRIMREMGKEPSPVSVLLNEVTTKSILVGLGAEPEVTEKGLLWRLS